MFVSIAHFASMICFCEWFWEWTVGVLGDIIVQDKPYRAVMLLLLTNSYWQVRHPQPSSVKQRFEFIVLPLLPQTRLQSESLSFALKHTSLLRKISLKQHKVVCWSACLLCRYSQLARLEKLWTAIKLAYISITNIPIQNIKTSNTMEYYKTYFQGL